MVATMTKADIGNLPEMLSVNRLEVAVVLGETEASGGPKLSQRSALRSRRRSKPNHWVVLDSTWAKRLGVYRTRGMYHITTRDLVSRLSEMGRPSRNVPR